MSVYTRTLTRAEVVIAEHLRLADEARAREVQRRYDEDYRARVTAGLGRGLKLTRAEVETRVQSAP